MLCNVVVHVIVDVIVFIDLIAHPVFDITTFSFSLNSFHVECRMDVQTNYKLWFENLTQGWWRSIVAKHFMFVCSMKYKQKWTKIHNYHLCTRILQFKFYLFTYVVCTMCSVSILYTTSHQHCVSKKFVCVRNCTWVKTTKSLIIFIYTVRMCPKLLTIRTSINSIYWMITRQQRIKNLN